MSGSEGMEYVAIHSSTNPAMCADITTYSVEGLTGPEPQKIFWERERLQPRSIETELFRHSVHIYNSEDEIDRALAVVSSLG